MSISDADAAAINLTRQTAGNFSTPGYILESAQDGIVAAPAGTQAGATQITTQTARVITVASVGNSVKLPPSLPGMELIVINRGANPMQVFGFGTDTINDVATATGVPQMQLSSVVYTCASSGAWYTEGLASGFNGGLPTVSARDALTATPSGTQGTSLLLVSVINRVTTVATAADGVKLPASGAGLQVTVTNAGSNSMNVFPGTGDSINGLGANVAYALGVGKTATMTCAGVGNWHALLSA